MKFSENCCWNIVFDFDKYVSQNISQCVLDGCCILASLQDMKA